MGGPPFFFYLLLFFFFSLSTGTKNDSEKCALVNLEINDHTQATSVIKKRKPTNPSGVTIISERIPKITEIAWRLVRGISFKQRSFAANYSAVVMRSFICGIYTQALNRKDRQQYFIY